METVIKDKGRLLLGVTYVLSGGLHVMTSLTSGAHIVPSFLVIVAGLLFCLDSLG